MLKVSAHGDEDHFKFQAKPARKQIRKFKKQFIREAKEGSECLVEMIRQCKEVNLEADFLFHESTKNTAWQHLKEVLATKPTTPNHH
ncbi:DUF7279 family protein [Proteus penneri]|uniref:DUF7279 family protein n=1 Tax=Proteus penneri TaxID=102862 RepID=UPI002100553B|nr:hypothetical protein [Proteus penneri]